MQLGYVIPDVQGTGDRTLAILAERLSGQGLSIAGLVQNNVEREGGGRCDMDVRILGNGPIIRISQRLGRGAQGCRLDSAALEQAVAEVKSRIDTSTDLLLINKFGKHEASGRGFRDLIGVALTQGLPVLIAVNEMNLAAFLQFTEGVAQELPLDCAALEAWVRQGSRP